MTHFVYLCVQQIFLELSICVRLCCRLYRVLGSISADASLLVHLASHCTAGASEGLAKNYKKC